VEKFLIVTLDTKLKAIGLHVITSGTLDASLVHPREVFAPAILASASSIILVHNHPSGDLVPSRQDNEVTDRLRKVGELLGIQVVDHIIVGHENGEFRGQSLLEVNQLAG
jgi:DNA repair protein RadC